MNLSYSKCVNVLLVLSLFLQSVDIAGKERKSIYVPIYDSVSEKILEHIASKSIETNAKRCFLHVQRVKDGKYILAVNYVDYTDLPSLQNTEFGILRHNGCGVFLSGDIDDSLFVKTKKSKKIRLSSQAGYLPLDDGILEIFLYEDGTIYYMHGFDRLSPL